MTAAVKQVTTIVKQIDELSARAANVGDKLHTHIKQCHEAIDLTDQLGNDLGDATAKLRASLGLHSNFPPQDSGQDA